jgi:dihydroneopterin aldolase
MDAPLDKLAINRSRSVGAHRIHAWEQQVRQRLSIDLELETDAARTAVSEKSPKHWITASSPATSPITSHLAVSGLIETLAEGIAQRVLDGFRLQSSRLRPQTGRGAGARDISIEIERNRAS